MKKTIEIEDNLNEITEGVIEEVKTNFIKWLQENPDVEDFDDYYQNEGCDSVHEIVDTSVPIYNYDIRCLYFLYGDEFEEAYENAGIGKGEEDNHQQVTIYCYLEEKAFNFINELQSVFEDYIERSSALTLSEEHKKQNLLLFIEEIKEMKE